MEFKINEQNTPGKTPDTKGEIIDKVWRRNKFYIHDEVKVDDRVDGFRTFDNEVYLRDKESGVIRATNKKVRGKAARKADKRNRRFGLKVTNG